MSRTRPTRTVAAALGVAAALSLGAAPAHADTRTVRDAAHDVLTGDASDSVPSGLATGRREGDVTSFTVTHGRRLVRLRLDLAQLSAPGTRTVVHSFRLATDERVRVSVDVVADADHPGGQVVWSRTSRRGARDCRAAHASIDHGSRTVRVEVPRRCLSQPRWVRAGGGSGALEGDALFADDAQLDAGLAHDLVLGPRVHR